MEEKDTFKEMHDSTSRELAILKTKLDYLIEAAKTAENYAARIEARVDALEKGRQWVVGAFATFSIVSGIAIYANAAYVRSISEQTIDDTSFIEETCKEFRARGRTIYEELPKLCQ